MTRILTATALCLTLFLPACANRTETPEGLVLPLIGPRIILIIGDSLTQYSGGFGLGAATGLEVTVRGVPGYDARDWLSQIDSAFDAEQPTTILVPLGTNDGYRFGPTEHRRNLTLLYDSIRVRSSAPVYFFLMPRTNDPGLATAILANNAALRSMPPAGEAGLIDLDAPFEAARAGASLYPLLDPIHPTEAGYRLIGDTIRTRLFLP